MRETFDIVSPTKQNVRGQVLLSPGIDAHGLRARPWKLLGFRFFEREDTAPGERFCKRMILIYNYNFFLLQIF